MSHDRNRDSDAGWMDPPRLDVTNIVCIVCIVCNFEMSTMFRSYGRGPMRHPILSQSVPQTKVVNCDVVMHHPLWMDVPANYPAHATL